VPSAAAQFRRLVSGQRDGLRSILEGSEATDDDAGCDVGASDVEGAGTSDVGGDTTQRSREAQSGEAVSSQARDEL